jgi:urease accessory protein
VTSWAARITRSEIHAPPEFAGLDPTAHPAARTGGARIELIPGDGTTILGECYQQVPVRVMPPFQLDDEPAALLYLINLTTGLLDGDAHRIAVTARSGARAVVTSQSANRVHPALLSYATQQFDVIVEDDAMLVVLPAPTIPYRGARFFQRVRAQVADGGRLLWGDIWLPGRYERGDLSERFVFETIVQDMEVRRGDRLAYRDRFRWTGPWTPGDIAWHAGDHLAMASLFVAGPLPDLEPTAPDEVRRAVFRLGDAESCIRWCGEPGLVTDLLVRTAMQVAGIWTGGPAAPPWLLDSSALSPNHWFSQLAPEPVRT